MSIPTCAVSAKFEDQAGVPVADALVTATLSSFEIYDGYVVPKLVEARTDSDGRCTLNLWPNQLGAVESSYTVRVVAPSGKRLTVAAVVPNALSANLHEISTLPPYPGKLDGQVSIEAAQAAGETAMAAMLNAQSAATSANASQLAAASSATAAAGSATAASGSATAAAGSATAASGSATAASGSATAASGSATAAAGSATSANSAKTAAEAARDVILAADYMPKTGGTFSGHVNVPANASGSQAPRASEVGALAVTQRALGTVSQSLGVPTGAIVEAGSNANGHYTRFADGTQICRHVLTTASGAGTTWTFPAGFAGVESVKVLMNAFGLVVFGVLDSAPGTASCVLSFRGTDNNRYAATGYLVAIGRWF